jgi:hypothetical protein
VLLMTEQGTAATAILNLISGRQFNFRAIFVYV